MTKVLNESILQFNQVVKIRYTQVHTLKQFTI